MGHLCFQMAEVNQFTAQVESSIKDARDLVSAVILCLSLVPGPDVIKFENILKDFAI